MVHATGETVPGRAVSVHGAIGGRWTLVRRGAVENGFVYITGNSVLPGCYLLLTNRVRGSLWSVTVGRSVRRRIGGRVGGYVAMGIIGVYFILTQSSVLFNNFCDLRMCGTIL